MSRLSKLEVSEAQVGPRQLKDPNSRDYAIQTLYALKQYAESFQCNQDLVCREIEVIEKYRHWKVLGYPSLNGLFMAELNEAGVANVRLVMTRAKKKAEAGREMAKHGESENSKAGVKLSNQVDNINLVTTKGGTSQSYLARRLKRDHGDIFNKLETYPSVRAAAIEAGIIKPLTALMQLERAWKRCSPEERERFLAQIKNSNK